MNKKYQALVQTIKELAAVSNLLPVVFGGINKDTRTIQKNDVYVAIVGEQFDGHKFINTAIDKGASFVITSLNLDKQIPYVLCENTVLFLQVWAKNYRLIHDATFIGITGSNGKTTTKELLFTVLKGMYKVYRTPGNYNNDIGVPLTVLNMPENIDYAVIEMGTNHVGEIPFLSKLVNPDHSVVTNIGFSHMANFSSVDELKKEKCSLYLNTKSNGKRFLNYDDALLKAEQYSNSVSFSVENKSDYQVTYKNFSNGKMIAICNGVELNLNILGEHLLSSVAISFAVAQTFGVDVEIIKKQLESFKPVSGRMEWIESENISYIHDAYNANPNSMISALEFFSKTDFKCKKIAVLGDMLELGNSSNEKHRKILCLLESMNIDEILLFGDEFNACNDKYLVFDTHEKIKKYINSLTGKKVVLLKGSRGMALEKVINLL